MAVALMLLVTCGGAQTNAAPEDAFSRELSKYPGLLPELGKLLERLKNEVQFPPDRSQSLLLPLLPASTQFYAAFPNYGDAAHQAWNIFQQELRQSGVLRDWWQHGANGAQTAQFEDFMQKFYDFSQYIGSEIAVFGNAESKDHLFWLAEVRKPGLKTFLQQTVEQWPGTPKPLVRVLDPQELAHADEQVISQGVVVVRPDFVVAGPNVKVVRDFNNFLDQKNSTFTSTPFAQRIQQSYENRTGVLIAADLQNILRQMPSSLPQPEDLLNRTGFDNVKYLVWEHKTVSGQAVGQGEVSFNGPRHGVASWLAAPSVLGSLDFVSPKAVAVWTVRLKNLAEIFDGVRELFTVANRNAFAGLDQMQQMMSINLRADLLSYLDGEVTFEFDGLADQQPEWTAVLQVKDPERLQQTLNKLLASTGQRPMSSSSEGANYYTVAIPSSRTPLQITYVFADGYMLIASSRDLARRAIQMHRSGASFARSTKFLSAPPKERSSQASAFMYYNPVSMTAEKLQSTSPEMVQIIANVQSTPITVWAYGDTDAIRVAGNGTGADASAVLIIAAIAIPNLLRAKIAANESSAVGTMRNIVAAQVRYAATYPKRGYAHDLPALSGDSSGAKAISADHAGFIDWTHGDASCPSSSSCINSGYRFDMVSRCIEKKCNEFTALATPISKNTGVRSFCTTSDGVIRFSVAELSAPRLSAAECRKWLPVE